MMNLILSLLIVFGSVLPHSSMTQGESSGERDAVLKACAAVFGPEIDVKNSLFEVDKLYLLEVKFDANGRLVQLGILPKHWFSDEHPEWAETEDVGELSEIEYTSLLGKLDGIRSKGKLKRRAKWPVVKATTATRRDIYTHAVLLTADVVDDLREDNTPRTVKYFIVYYAAAK